MDGFLEPLLCDVAPRTGGVGVDIYPDHLPFLLAFVDFVVSVVSVVVRGGGGGFVNTRHCWRYAHFRFCS